MNTHDEKTCPGNTLITRLTAISGFAGTLSITLGSLVTAFAYRGRTGEPYLVLNHFVSELGEVGVSRLAAVFNTGLVITGVCFTIFMLGVAYQFKGWFRYVFGLSGVLTGIAGGLVGIFPMNNLEAHTFVALSYFYLGLFVIGIFSLAAALSRKREFPRWMALPGGLTFAAFFSFLFLTDALPEAASGEEADRILAFTTNRPPVWGAAILEWAVIGAVVAWVVIVSFYLYTQAKAEHEF